MKRMHAFRLAALVLGVLGCALAPVRAADPNSQVPEEARRHLQEALGGPFVVFRARVQDDLKLSDSAKQKLEDALLERIQDAMGQFESFGTLSPEERDKRMAEYRPKAHEKLNAALKQTLTEEQLKRLRQVELQLDGIFSLGRPEIGEAIALTPDQRTRFVAVVMAMHTKIQPLIKEAQGGASPDVIRPKVMAIRKMHEAEAEDLLTETQKKRWKDLLGAPINLGD